MNDLIFLGEGGVPLLDSDSEETKRKIAGGGMTCNKGRR